MKHWLLAVLVLLAFGGSVSAQVVVPPGHRVVAFSSAANAHADKAESGALIVDFGSKGEWSGVQAKVDRQIAAAPTSFAIVILQYSAIEELAASREFEKLMSRWQVLKERGAQVVWVLPLRAATTASTVSALKAAGFGVHGSAPDGACFVEVHKPDGTIVVGMPGSSL